MTAPRTRTWTFETAARALTVKTNLPMRHPGNMVNWIDDKTVELTGNVGYTQHWLRTMGGREVDKPA